MPRDTQVVRTPNQDAPYDYLVPQNVEMILRGVRAKFTDNGASGDWLPCVDLISDSGHRIARCADPNVKVTAGDDADVSWFPGVKPAGGASTSSAAIVVARGDCLTPPSIPAGASQSSAFDTVTTSDSSVLSWSTTTHTNDTLNMNAAGATTLLLVSALWNGAVNQDVYIQTPGSVAMRHDAWNSFFGTESSPSAGFANRMDQVWTHTVGGTAGFTVSLHNSAGFPNGPQEVTLFAVCFPGVFPT